MPWLWKEGPEKEELKRVLGERFGGKAHLFGSGRESLLAILKSLRLQKDEEVIVQGYTCVVVPNAIIAAGMTPIFADIEEDTLNLDIAEVERLITPRTRAIICQHTFGIPAFTKELRTLCDRTGLILIEDCAHVMPDIKGPTDIGTRGDVMFFSFGRDKAISGVNGGAVICRRSDICTDLQKLEDDAVPFAVWQIKRWLQYPMLYGIAKPVYGIGLGKVMLAVFGKLGMLAPITTRKEKQGQMDSRLHRMPNAMAILALQQWTCLNDINNHRRMLTDYYFNEAVRRNWPLLLGVTPDLPLQKFPLFTEHAERIRQALKKQNIHLHDGWTGCVICPADSDEAACGYKDGDDPDAEMAGRQILCLPTNPDTSMEQARKLIELLDPLLSSR